MRLVQSRLALGTALRPAVYDHGARRDRHRNAKSDDDKAVAGTTRNSGGASLAAAAARKAEIVAERSAIAAQGIHQRQRHTRRKAVVERPPSLAGWSEAPAIFRGDGGYNTIDARDSVAGADDLRAAMAQKMKEVNDRKNAALELKAARIRSARIESEATHRRPASARRSAVTAMAGAWRDGKEDCIAGDLLQSAAAADAALRKLAEAAVLADARRAQAVELRREAAHEMAASVSARHSKLRDKTPGIGEREAAAARMQANSRQLRAQLSAARGPDLPISARVRRKKKQNLPETEKQRLQHVTEQYESAAALAANSGHWVSPEGGEVVASEASEDIVARGST